MSQKGNPSSSLIKNFFISAFGTGLSRVLGAARDIVIAHYFGAGKLTDAFWMAWTVPAVFRRFVADEGFTGAMIPAIVQEETNHGISSTRQLTDRIFTMLLIGLIIFCALGILLAPYLVRLFAWGYLNDPGKFNLTVNLTRWLFPFVALASLVSYCEGILNHRNHFFIPKLAPGLVSAGIIISVVFLAFNPPIYALVFGVLVGGVLHLAIQFPVLARRWWLPKLNFSFNSPRLKFFLKEMGKVILIGIFAQINVVVLRLLASFLETGSVTLYWNANRLMDLTHGIIAIGMGSALMPVMAQQAALKNWEEVRGKLEYSLRVTAFFLIPASVILIFFHIPIVTVLFRHGNFTYKDSLVTASILQLLVPFLLALACINIIKKVYFALDERNTLLKVGAFGVALTAATGGLLISVLGITGLPIALSFSTVVQLMFYLWLLNKKVRKIIRCKSLFSPFSRIVLASIPSGIILYVCSGLGDWQRGPKDIKNIIIFIGSLLLAGIAYLVSAYFLKLPTLKAVLKRMWPPKKIRSD